MGTSSVFAQVQEGNSYPFLGNVAPLQPDSTKKEGKITIHTNPEMDALFEKYATLSEEKRIPIRGYRVQIASASGNNAKSSVNSVKSNFLTNYPDVPAYLIWESPNYKIRVGDFRSKLDAEKFQRRIGMLFPYAFIVRDNINFPSLEKEEEEK